ncbi:NAD(P)H-hydrate epimerase [Halosimplex salinum]|uniref:NAD(P)H-hydrate epimerase n=1 Tax=Halosimplex salinum TaxID=1710538 RepID=UPI000F482A2D|nr:NAD(P)H-hydrate epimerase [Halosimplex salinum]
MDRTLFETGQGQSVTAVTAEEMRAVDRVAVETFGLGLLQMMENAGRNIASHVRERGREGVTVLAGNGGNGGGGLCAARHLANREIPVSVVLDRDPDDLDGAARSQYDTLAAMGVPVGGGPDALTDSDAAVVVDALVGYGLEGPLRGTPADLLRAVDEDSTVVSLDVPSGLNATTGERAGVVADSDSVVTLALPKTGLAGLDADLVLADIAVPSGVYEAFDIPYANPFRDGYRVSLAE